MDNYNEIFEEIDIRTVSRFFEIYPWVGLRYGDFNYGDLLRYGSFFYNNGAQYGDATNGTRYYGEDVPDLLSVLAIQHNGFEELYKVPAIYSEVKYGSFEYGGSLGVQDAGGEIICMRPLIYSNFCYGDGSAKYGGENMWEVL